ncbi:Glycosyltransferase involved in cell wall bisynthesis [Sinomicrobium oceani]|uniref:Glycosyltransferase involved in cell wall bisynthesis n=1 Tax=Sinomicrobium oceani TaxID=1150368 RepID=A0A1K1MT64_9FLAO|nr:glycosyltransferase family 2 protein [Sinomicrobium oceani]SFW26380.1 Glycosyltransferase involved in cell wall bisynthesis [Sinomicrobium oceani]
MNISVVIPLLNEQESLRELHDWIARVMLSNRFSYEILFIDDGSTDRSWETIEALAAENDAVKGIRFFRNYGKSQALHAGFRMARGEVVITMDADLQDNPEEIPELYDLIVNQKFDLISGWKKKRYDDVLTKNIPSKLFNWAARKTSGLKLHDFNCGLKAYRKEVIKNIEVYGEMHRYIPVLAKNAGFAKIEEKVVQHQSRKYGKTKFGMERFIHGFLDLITIWFLSRFGKRPMHLFGALGVLMFLIGFLSAGFIGADKLYKLYHQQPTILVTQNPWFFIALATMIIGSQLFLAGFLGEIILRNKTNNDRYKISDVLNVDMLTDQKQAKQQQAGKRITG